MSRKRKPPKPRRMTGEEMAAWMEQMGVMRGWSGRDCARELGVGVNQPTTWSRLGAPYYIALACQALIDGVPPYTMDSWEYFNGVEPKPELADWVGRPPGAATAEG